MEVEGPTKGKKKFETKPTKKEFQKSKLYKKEIQILKSKRSPKSKFEAEVQALQIKKNPSRRRTYKKKKEISKSKPPTKEEKTEVGSLQKKIEVVKVQSKKPNRRDLQKKETRPPRSKNLQKKAAYKRNKESSEPN